MQSSSQVSELTSFAGIARSEIARRTGCAVVRVYDEIASTMDLAHELAQDGAESGTLVVAEKQLAGRGREGRKWESGNTGVAFTVLVRNGDGDAAQVLSVRTGLLLRAVLAELSPATMRLKWPNDIHSEHGKVSGILVETRWRGSAPEWTAVGVGINIVPPDGVPGAAGLGNDVARGELLIAAASAVREAAEAAGPLSRDEVQDYMQNDMLRGRRVSAPLEGVVVGISEDGELVVSGADGILTARSGSVVMEEGE